jgi:hypothetical protein
MLVKATTQILRCGSDRRFQLWLSLGIRYEGLQPRLEWDWIVLRRSHASQGVRVCDGPSDMATDTFEEPPVH